MTPADLPPGFQPTLTTAYSSRWHIAGLARHYALCGIGIDRVAPADTRVRPCAVCAERLEALTR